MNLIREYLLTRKVFFNLLVFLLWGKILLAYMRGIVGMLPVIGEYQYEAEVFVVVCVLLLALPSMLNRLAPLDWMLLMGSLAVYLLQFVAFPINEDYLWKFMYSTLCLVIPFFLFGRVLCVQDYVKPMTIISMTCIILDALYFLVYMRDPVKMAERYAGEYYMSQAYALLPHVMFIAWRCMKEFGIWKLLLVILGTALILAYGSRGPLACLGCFCIIGFFFFTKFKYSLWLKSAVIALAAICLLFAKPILLFLQELFSEMDMSTRIIERMLSGGLTHDTGRGFTKVKLYELLNQSDSLWGYGLFGCKRFVLNYPHNYQLDFFFAFGYLAGGALLLLTTYIIVKAMVVARSSCEREFILLLACASILKLQVSSSFINEGIYFTLLGYCVTILITHRYARK